MLFEEFFKKKRIDLDALQKAEGALFSEFKIHYGQMGEKSFDHTKKYWFNKLRREFPLAIEAKTEKVKIDNPLAEQTITESLIESRPSSAKPGFVPRFKAANTTNPAAEQPAAAEPAAAIKPEEPSVTPSAPKPGFTPRFKAASLPKPTADEPAAAIKPEEPSVTPSAPKPGFTPRFKAVNLPKPAADQPAEEVKPDEPVATPTAPKPGFTPRFKAANMPKPTADQPIEDVKADIPTEIVATEETKGATPLPPAAEEAVAKPAYKPRFNMKNLPKKEEE